MSVDAYERPYEYFDCMISLENFCLSPIDVRTDSKLSTFLVGYDFQSIFQVDCPRLRKAFLRKKNLLKSTNGRLPAERVLFHVTSKENAKKILQEGFNPKLAQSCAFGRGIYFSETAVNAFKYARKHKEKALLICKVIIGKSHENASDLDNIVNGYSKPQRLLPPKGFNSMYGGPKETKVWVIPTSNQILPLYLVI